MVSGRCVSGRRHACCPLDSIDPGGDHRAAPQLLEQNRAKIQRVFLLTGEDDQVAENTKRAGEMLKDAHIRVRVKIAPGLGHEVPADRMITNYRRPLRWLLAAM